MAFQLPSQTRLLAIALSILLFAASVASPAFHSDGSDQTAGWSALLIGWVPALFGVLGLLQGQAEMWTCLAWFANPLLVVCLVLVMQRRGRALTFGLAALGLGLVFLATRSLPAGDHSLSNVVPGVGYWLWIASMLAAIVGAVLTERLKPAGTARAVASDGQPLE